MSNRVSHLDSPMHSRAHSEYAKLPTDDPSLTATPAAEHSRPVEEELDAIAPEPVEEEVDPRVASIRRDDALQIVNRWQFVESNWFRTLVVLTFFSSTIVVVLQVQGSGGLHVLKKTSVCMTGVMFFELMAKWWHYGKYYLNDHWTYVIWNVLDIFLVAVAFTDNLLTFGCMVVWDGSTTFIAVTFLRFLRLLQIVKVLNMILEFDLSWQDAPWFQSFIGVVIVFNAALMGFETDIDSPVWVPIEQCLLCIYTAELLVRMKKQGTSKFLSQENNDCAWNWLDFVIVVSSAADSWGLGMINMFLLAIADQAKPEEGSRKESDANMSLAQIMMLMRMLRLLRILRIVKLIKAVQPLYILVLGVSAAIQGVFWVLVLTVVTLYAMSIVATRLIGHALLFGGAAAPDADVLETFGNVPESIFLLFRVMSGAISDDEEMKLDSLMNSTPAMKFSFVFFMVASSWTLLSILTAVVSEKMITTVGDETAEADMMSYEDDRARHKEALTKLFASLDDDGNGYLELKELDPLLDNPTMAAKISRICRVPARNVRDCFHTLSRHTGVCEMNAFVESMLDIAKVKTEQSVMKIQAHLLDAQHEVERVREAHHARLATFLSRLRENELKHYKVLAELERKHAEQEQKHTDLILEMEQKNADQEQRHAEAVMGMVENNGKLITSVLEAVNELATRQKVIETTIAETDDNFCDKMATIEHAQNQALQTLQRRVESMVCFSDEGACEVSSLVSDKKNVQVSTKTEAAIDQGPLLAASSHSDMPLDASSCTDHEHPGAEAQLAASSCPPCKDSDAAAGQVNQGHQQQ